MLCESVSNERRAPSHSTPPASDFGAVAQWHAEGFDEPADTADLGWDTLDYADYRGPRRFTDVGELP